MILTGWVAAVCVGVFVSRRPRYLHSCDLKLAICVYNCIYGYHTSAGTEDVVSGLSPFLHDGHHGEEKQAIRVPSHFGASHLTCDPDKVVCVFSETKTRWRLKSVLFFSLLMRHASPHPPPHGSTCSHHSKPAPILNDPNYDYQ